MYMLTEHCLICSNANHLGIQQETHAWECWHCNTRWWLDDQARLEYMVHYDINFAQAETDLKMPHPSRRLNFATLET